ncbi:hypothetical protein BegalDRAFT_0414 [Beggiatoa alba B18LD]|uniref:Uncharacterized protein n=1 Tax=Beggiatoa alba B18LD TaxID=395493 RepID=I3CCJ0_9GAMM|nr:hypothetical protein [Beggiatoa alba]EIJ41333.1 hypothetical protein BegalDRAFT_0414 [Beggiatoa alba B18LD]
MQQAFSEKELCFNFPKNYQVIKYDETKFYEKFKRLNELICPKLMDKLNPTDSEEKNYGISGVDFLVIDVEKSILWLLEVKNFNTAKESKSLDRTDKEFIKAFVNDITIKIVSTLSALLPFKINAEDDEKVFANYLCRIEKINIVLYIETKKEDEFICEEMQKKLRQKFKNALDKSNIHIFDNAILTRENKLSGNPEDICSFEVMMNKGWRFTHY